MKLLMKTISGAKLSYHRVGLIVLNEIDLISTRADLFKMEAQGKLLSRNVIGYAKLMVPLIHQDHANHFLTTLSFFEKKNEKMGQLNESFTRADMQTVNDFSPESL